MTTVSEPKPDVAYGIKWLLKPAAWFFYFVIVCEILFMISPFALHFYSAYGPTLNVLHRAAATAWLTQFFLPHFSTTASPILNAVRQAGMLLILTGLLAFLAAALPLYWSKLARKREVTGGLYRWVRHPQYTALAVLGLGTTLVWPRFLVLVTFVTMLCLYMLLAHWEEDQCLRRFGDGYRAYMHRTGMFLPRAITTRLPNVLPDDRVQRVTIGVVACAVAMPLCVAGAFWLRDYSLAKLSAEFEPNVAVLSPAPLTDAELREAYATAAGDQRVRDALAGAPAGPRIVYVVPDSWHLPDVPLEMDHGHRGHQTPRDFERGRYKLLFTRARSHATDATGADILKTAYGREPLLRVRVDAQAGEVTAIEEPPPHVRWGDIPTPMF